jgi:hypothetical protein
MTIALYLTTEYNRSTFELRSIIQHLNQSVAATKREAKKDKSKEVCPPESREVLATESTRGR